MHGAFPGRDPGQTGSGPAQPPRGDGQIQAAPQADAARQQQAHTWRPLSFLPFLDGVLDDEHKTRRLGYLIRQAGLVVVVILISLTALGYIWLYKSPMLAKVGIGSGSSLLIAGSLVVRFKRASRADRNLGNPDGVVTAPPPPLEQGHDNRVCDSHGPDGKHGSDGNPHNDLGAASRS